MIRRDDMATSTSARPKAPDVLLGAGACALAVALWSLRPVFTAAALAERASRGPVRDMLASALAARGTDLRRRVANIVEATFPLMVQPLLEVVLDAVDLTALVQEHVDINELGREVDIDAVVARIDLEAIIVRLDLAGLARKTIDEVDLPQIMWESSGTLASETVRGVRAECTRADNAVDRLVDRVLRRHPASL
jgi:hypothetical protein